MLRDLRQFTLVPTLLLTVALMAAALVACFGDDDDDEGTGAGATSVSTPVASAPAPSEPLQVVASTGILAHFAEQIAGEHAEVVALIPPGADVHSFSTSAADIRKIDDADVVIVNGFNLEESILGTIFEHLPGSATLIVAAKGIEPLEGGHHHDHGHGHEDEDDHGHMDEDDHAHEDDDDHAHEDDDDHAHEDDDDHAHEDDDDHAHEDDDDHAHEDDDDHAHEDDDDHGHEDDHAEVMAPEGAELAVADGDPHMWLTVKNAMVYVQNIADGLAAADPDNAAEYRQRAEAYLAELQALDEEVHAAISQIPQDHRVLIVYHDAFQYFAVEYGLELAAAVLPGNPSQQASAAAVAEIIEIVAGRHVGAVYREPQFPADALEAIAEEAGVEVLVLYSGAFAGDVDTYVELMRANAQALVEGLAH
ncbi:MAG: metal ABC transporter substrate-binding protein [Chloroflexi bacterium]|nr:metal ABC transporter substrate-binding protein [Chloroflexota bacterium]